MEPDGGSITGPRDLAIVEQIRKEARLSNSAVPVDVFVWAEGEPASRELTKIGGLPYRSADSLWPTDFSGSPLAFVAQLSFVDSRDIFPSIPGDVLLIFGTNHDDVLTEEPGALRFEWVTIPQADLVGVESIAETDWDIASMNAHIHRSMDYPDSVRALDGYDSPETIAVFEGTKIGGAPRWIQYSVNLPGRFLGAVASLNPGISAFPLLNRSDPFKDWSDDLLMFGDLGSLYLFLDGDQIAWTIQNY